MLSPLGLGMRSWRIVKRPGNFARKYSLLYKRSLFFFITGPWSKWGRLRGGFAEGRGLVEMVCDGYFENAESFLLMGYGEK